MGADYVNRLYDGVIRNFPGDVEFRFICFTDDPTGLEEGIITKPLPEGLNGWWNKLYLFSPEAFNAGDRVLYFDLDTVIVSKLDDIAAYKGDFAILRDFYRPEGLGSATMAWEAGKVDFIWSDWLANGKPEVLGGDQAWIEKITDFVTFKPDIWQELYPYNFVSYKVHAQRGIPKGARVVCFHGLPRPHMVQGNWVEKVWKVGGATSLEMDVCANTGPEVWVKNIESAVKLPYPWVVGDENIKGHAVIVGGGPSVSNFVQEIAWRKSEGQKIFALNGSAKWLVENGIEPDYHVLLDARPENAGFLIDGNHTRLIASCCDPEVFSKAGDNIIVWHPLVPGIQDYLPAERPYALIGGGSTVGLLSISMADVMGLDEIHVYGMDSSYQDDKGHVYEQPLNDGERVVDIEVGDKKFKAAAWMVTQASEFQDLASQLVNKGRVITIHGDGLLPYIASTMQSLSEPSDGIVEVDGDFWPEQTGKWHIDYAACTIKDVDEILKYCHKFDVVVQAGGHIGAWPREFAKHFKAVYTFEPDAVNFRCLNLNATASNIIKMQAVLGKDNGLVSIARNTENSGASFVSGAGAVPTIRIDDLGLTACDLIQLDVEGFEGHALMGAVQTIERFSPTIVIESNGLEARAGFSEGETVRFIESLGYRQAAAVHRDLIFVKQQ